MKEADRSFREAIERFRLPCKIGSIRDGVKGNGVNVRPISRFKRIIKPDRVKV